MQSSHPRLDIVRLLFSNERSCAVLYRDAPDEQMGIDPYCGLDLEKMAAALASSKASATQVIEWMAMMFCAIRSSGFSSTDTAKISYIRSLFKPLVRRTGVPSIDAMLARALQRGCVLANSMPDPEATLEQLQFAARVFDLPL